ncbi:hypothetical protein [Streptomyces sp. NPDC020607]|uniref:hypothetical protein n=1 Tax=Streptomyces sp. NPDC020607 TaxID=3365082 RepID=UPI00379B6CD4
MWRLPVAGAVWAVCAGAVALSGALLAPARGDSDAPASAASLASPAPVAEVAPARAHHGDSVTLTLHGCGDPDAGGRAEGQPVGDGTTARTPVEVTDLRAGADGALQGRAEISPRARTGRAEISFACSADPTHVVTATVTILAPTPAASSSPRGALEAGK